MKGRANWRVLEGEGDGGWVLYGWVGDGACYRYTSLSVSLTFPLVAVFDC